MTSSSTVVPLRQPGALDEDPLTAILRSGARRLLAQAVEAEAEAFLAAMKSERLADGRDRLVRHGHGPERQVQTGIGPVAVQRVRVRDRGGDAGERIRFTSAILPRWARRTRSLDARHAGALLAWPVDGRFPGGARGAAGQGGPEPVAVGDRAPAQRVGGRPCALAATRPVGPALRVCLGRRRLPARAHGAAGGMHAAARSGPRRKARKNCSASRWASGKARRAGANCWLT